MLEGILWDNDGVLVNTEKLFFEVNRDFFSQYDITLTERNFFDWFLRENCGAWHLLTDRGLATDDVKSLRVRRDQLYSHRLAAANDLATIGIGEVLNELSLRVPMGIVTSARSEHFELIHSKLDLLHYFQFVLTEEMYGKSKPSPEPYLLGLKRLGVSGSQCLVIEDSPRGLHAAIAAGIRCIVLRNSMMLDYAFDGAYRIVDSAEELLQEIKMLL